MEKIGILLDDYMLYRRNLEGWQSSGPTSTPTETSNHRKAEIETTSTSSFPLMSPPSVTITSHEDSGESKREHHPPGLQSPRRKNLTPRKRKPFHDTSGKRALSSPTEEPLMRRLLSNAEKVAALINDHVDVRETTAEPASPANLSGTMWEDEGSSLSLPSSAIDGILSSLSADPTFGTLLDSPQIDSLLPFSPSQFQSLQTPQDLQSFQSPQPQTPQPSQPPQSPQSPQPSQVSHSPQVTSPSKEMSSPISTPSVSNEKPKEKKSLKEMDVEDFLSRLHYA